MTARWEHFPHGADVGVRGFGPTKAESFAGINCALANRQILTHLVRQVFREILPQARLPLLYDVSLNTCKVEEHRVDGGPRKLYVHRKGATRAFGPGHPDLPEPLREAGDLVEHPPDIGVVHRHGRAMVRAPRESPLIGRKGRPARRDRRSTGSCAGSDGAGPGRG
jgi:hypothetical protein